MSREKAFDNSRPDKCEEYNAELVWSGGPPLISMEHVTVTTVAHKDTRVKDMILEDVSPAEAAAIIRTLTDALATLAWPPSYMRGIEQET